MFWSYLFNYLCAQIHLKCSRNLVSWKDTTTKLKWAAKLWDLYNYFIFRVNQAYHSAPHEFFFWNIFNIFWTNYTGVKQCRRSIDPPAVDISLSLFFARPQLPGESLEQKRRRVSDDLLPVLQSTVKLYSEIESV